MRYLLDTNIISDVMRSSKGKCAARIAEVGESSVFTSIIVVCELRFGVAKKRSLELTRRLHGVLGAIDVANFEPPADIAYAQQRTKLESSGTPIGANDLLIAAHALALGAILVTDNEREFSRVPGLKIENWLRSTPA
jgi:tRNA(fMet)-specific endonuclease VapC